MLRHAGTGPSRRGWRPSSAFRSRPERHVGLRRARASGAPSLAPLPPTPTPTHQPAHHRAHQVTGPFTEEVGPHDGNVHEITATSENGMAFFDVITPPYRSKVPFYKCNVEGLVEEVSVDYYSGGFEKRMCDYRGARPDLAAVDAACRDKHELTEEEHQLVYAAKARNKRWRRYQL